jgi:hypothetical protein
MEQLMLMLFSFANIYIKQQQQHTNYYSKLFASNAVSEPQRTRCYLSVKGKMQLADLETPTHQLLLLMQLQVY